MKQGPLRIESALKPELRLVVTPRLLITLEPWHRVFFRNLRDLFWTRRQPPLKLSSRPGAFWPDVFVTPRLPWGRFLESVVYHTAVLAALWAFARFWPRPSHLAERPVFHSSDVIYYQASDYLPPLDTGAAQAQPAKKGEPEHAPQPVISVPPEADNRTQTIVAPPKLKLNQDVPLPNVVAWARATPTIPRAVVADPPANLKLPALPTPVIAPAPDVSRSNLDPAPAMSESVIAPPPEVNAAESRRSVHDPQPSIVEPPPDVNAASSRRLSDINIGHAQVIEPAPLLPLGEQRARASLPQAGRADSGPAVVAPPPSLSGTGTSNQEGRLIALNLHPVVAGGPVEVPSGNRRGTFAATPEGKPGAPGTPDIAAPHTASNGADGHSTEGKSTNGVPPGLFVGSSAKPENSSAIAGTSSDSGSKTPSDSRLVASATPPRVTALPRRSAAETSFNNPTELERKVFAGRKSYSMMLNVPNLNSAGGSWVMHFAELKEGEKQGDLVAPVATQAVDPGYPLELMRRNVQGTVTLSAVIQSDGSVGEVQVLNGVDDRLDEYARAALSRWRFRPAMKNGNPVALQAVVMIPFRPMLRKSGF
jgi:TonB family protein